MPVDNIDNISTIRHAEKWWDEDDPLNMLHGSVKPGRLAYFVTVLTDRLGRDLSGLRALDIGCGGGFLAEECARLGCQVVGVDPSAASLQTAQRHARDSASLLTTGSGREHLPVQDAEFDLAYCWDVLEHVSDLDRVISETTRARCTCPAAAAGPSAAPRHHPTTSTASTDTWLTSDTAVPTSTRTSGPWNPAPTHEATLGPLSHPASTITGTRRSRRLHSRRRRRPERSGLASEGCDRHPGS